MDCVSNENGSRGREGLSDFCPVLHFVKGTEQFDHKISLCLFEVSLFPNSGSRRSVFCVRSFRFSEVSFHWNCTSGDVLSFGFFNVA